MEWEDFYNTLYGKYGDWLRNIEKWLIIQSLGIKPYRDGNQWCLCYGENIQEGICAFGKTLYECVDNFYHEITKQY